MGFIVTFLFGQFSYQLLQWDLFRLTYVVEGLKSLIMKPKSLVLSAQGGRKEPNTGHCPDNSRSAISPEHIEPRSIQPGLLQDDGQ